MAMTLTMCRTTRRAVGPRRGAGRGFTLVEMLVSLAVLTLALTAVGAVFAVTTKAVGQAAAYSEMQNWTRQFMDQLQEDLRYCEPSKSILVIAGRTQSAALTEPDRQAQKYYRELVGDLGKVPSGYDPAFDPYVDNHNGTGDPLPQYSDPRADILMFFSNRPTTSQAPVANPLAGSMAQVFANGVKATPIQVVYGHAALGQAVKSGTSYAYPGDGDLVHIEPVPDPGRLPAETMSRLPANRWQLARRAVIWDASSAKPGTAPNYSYSQSLDAQRLLRCQPDVSATGYGPPQGGDVARVSLPALLEQFEPVSMSPLDGAALVSPYRDIESGGSSPAPPWPTSIRTIVGSLLYPGAQSDNWRRHHVATILEDVPAELRSNTNLRALPGCVWFQVEFLMGEDPRNSLEYTPPAPNTIPGNPNPSQRGELMRWVSAEVGQTYLFVPDTEANRALVAAQVNTTGTSGSTFAEDTRLATFARKDQNANAQWDKADAIPQRIIRMWPYAIRVTVRAYDSRGRLDRPIVRSIVHRFD